MERGCPLGLSSRLPDFTSQGEECHEYRVLCSLRKGTQKQHSEPAILHSIEKNHLSMWPPQARTEGTRALPDPLVEPSVNSPGQVTQRELKDRHLKVLTYPIAEVLQVSSTDPWGP